MDYLQASYYLDFNHKNIKKITSKFNDAGLSDKEKAIKLYTFVRDNWLYNPYDITLLKDHYKASFIAEKPSGNCIEKSVLLVACLRGLHIPARLHLGKVKNHIAVDKLTEKFGSNELTPHGMVNVFLNDKWLKLSPAFNKSLCEKFNVPPLDFDGENHSFLQQYNSDGNLFMEYLDDYGHFADVPLDFMKANIKQHYPHIFDTKENITTFKL